MKKFLIPLLLLSLGFTGVASGKKKDEAAFSFNKGGSYYIGSVSVEITGRDKTSDKKETFNSSETLGNELRSALAKILEAKGKLAQDAGSAQATLDIKITYQRNFLGTSAQRMPAFMWFEITAKKDGVVLGSYSSDKLLGKGNPYKRVSNEKEFLYMEALAIQIGEKILKSEK